MATSGKAPFNIRKVNGQWLFTEGVFGGQYSIIAPELRIVPEDMIPDEVYAGGKTGYIPESEISSYFTSQKFVDVATRVARVHPEGILAGGRGVDATTATRSIANSVQMALSDVDEKAHVARSKVAKKAKAPAVSVTPVFGAADSSGGFTTPWTSGVSLAHDPTSGLLLNVETGQLLNKNKQEVFMLPDPSTDRLGSPQMKLSGKVVQSDDLANRVSRMPSKTIEVWEKALGLPVTGAYSDKVAQSIMGYARLATQRNWTRSLSGDTGGFKPVSEMDMLLEAKKSGALGASKTSTSTSTTRFNIENSGAFITDMFQQLVGRDPSQQEQQQWVEKLTAAARKKPSRSTTTQTGRNYSTTSEEGFTADSAKQMVRNQLAMSPESQSLMASTNLYDAFLQAIQNPMG
jgi:hypothetical protein